MQSEENDTLAKKSGSIVLKNYRHEQFAKMIASGIVSTDAYAQLYNKDKATSEDGAKRLLSLQYITDRIKFLRETEASSWSKDRATEELKRILDDVETKPRDRIQAISELNDIHGLKRPTQQNLNFENKGIVFNCPDGISLPPGFLEDQSKRLKDIAESKVIDITPEQQKQISKK